MTSMDAVTQVPAPVNEPVRQYAPGSAERAELESTLKRMASEPRDLTMTIGGEQRFGGGERDRRRPAAQPRTTCSAPCAARPTRTPGPPSTPPRPPRPAWRAMSFDDRAAILLKAADLLAGPWRATLNAATMLGQSKTAIQAEIDSACELIDFWRFNVAFARQIYAEQPISSPGRVEPHRPPPARGLRLRDHAVQLHRDRRQPADRAGADGQHRGVEAGADASSSPRTC